jgi:hypothetical protein
MTLARTLPRLVAALAVLTGVLLVVLGLQRTPVLGDSATLVGRMPLTQKPVVVTALGMTELDGSSVRLRAASASAGAPVFIGVGRADDVDAFLADAARAELTGLRDGGVLDVVSRAGQPTLPDPSGVDVWAASVRTGGVATLTWPRTQGRWRAVIATDGVTPPSAVELTWSGAAGSSSAPALLAVGAVLCAAGAAGLAAMRSGRLLAPAPSSWPEPAPAQGLPFRRRLPGAEGDATADPEEEATADPEEDATAGTDGDGTAGPGGSRGPSGPVGER